MEYLSNTYFLLALTFAIYAASQILQSRTGWSFLNPILISAILIIAYLNVNDISIDTYNEGGRYIEFWLKPAIVALGVPLYKQLSTIRKPRLPLRISAHCRRSFPRMHFLWTDTHPRVAHDAHWQPHRTGSVARHSRTRRGHFASYGRERQVRCIRQPRTYPQRHLHSPAHTHCTLPPRLTPTHKALRTTFMRRAYNYPMTPYFEAIYCRSTGTWIIESHFSGSS